MKRLQFVLLYFAAWVPVAAIYSLLIYSTSSESSKDGAVFGGIQSTLTAALLGGAVWVITRRLAERARPARSLILAHVALALGYTAAWTGFVTLSIALFAPSYVLGEFVQYGAGWQLLTGLFLYGMVAGIAHALYVSRRLQREREIAVRADALRARAELNALRAQMNPHFLFNTLHSISALVRTDPRAVEDALERLAVLLRRLLDVNRSGVDQIALAEEWEIVRDQLELEKLRFGERLRVITDIETDALECQIPVFTLQPLVENAVKHGMAARAQRCTITIRARVAADQLTIEVSDDGPGADVRAALTAPGLGLRALRQRLMAQYGDRAGLHLDSTQGAGGGFKVQVSLPAVAATQAQLRAPAPSGETASV